MKQATLIFLLDEKNKKVSLAMKKRGFGEGKYNGFGGKVNEGETIEQAALRELHEESSVIVTNPKKQAILHFYFTKNPEWNQSVHVFTAKEWEGQITESEEMKPEWFDHKDIPFHKMWQDDKHWLPLVLAGKNIEASFTFKEDNETIDHFDIKQV